MNAHNNTNDECISLAKLLTSKLEMLLNISLVVKHWNTNIDPFNCVLVTYYSSVLANIRTIAYFFAGGKCVLQQMLQYRLIFVQININEGLRTILFLGKTTRLLELKMNFGSNNCRSFACIVFVNCYEKSHSNRVVYFYSWSPHLNTFMRWCTRFVKFVNAVPHVFGVYIASCIFIFMYCTQTHTLTHMMRTIDFNFTSTTKITSVEQLKYMMMVMAVVEACV